jgi:hypothetical protein
MQRIYTLLSQPSNLLHFQNLQISIHYVMLGLHLGLQGAQPAAWQIIKSRWFLSDLDLVFSPVGTGKWTKCYCPFNSVTMLTQVSNLGDLEVMYI